MASGQLRARFPLCFLYWEWRCWARTAFALFHFTSSLFAAGGLSLALAPLALTDEQLKEFESILGEMKGGWAELRGLPSTCKGLQDENAQLKEQISGVRRLMTSRIQAPRVRAAGLVSDDCARHLSAHFILHCERSGKLEALASVPAQRDALLTFAREPWRHFTGGADHHRHPPAHRIRRRDSRTDLRLRRRSPAHVALSHRHGHRPSGAHGHTARLRLDCHVGGHSPRNRRPSRFASLESHKIGGIVRLPREIDEQSIVAMGQFLARYGAVEFARAEDTWGFLADGGGTYETVKGIVQIARDNAKTVVLAATKTKPSDATLDGLPRPCARKVNKAALNGRLSAYYLDSTWETQLPSFRTTAEPNVYQRLPMAPPSSMAIPIVWTDVLTPYGTSAAADQPLAVFGALSFWWMGEHGTPRIDTSEHVWFANDQLAVRFIEEIDFDYAATDATAALLTAAS